MATAKPPGESQHNGAGGHKAVADLQGLPRREVGGDHQRDQQQFGVRADPFDGHAKGLHRPQRADQDQRKQGHRKIALGLRKILRNRAMSSVINASTAKIATVIFCPVVDSGRANAVATAKTCRAFARFCGRSFQATFISSRIHIFSSFRALAFSTFGLISSRMSSLAKSDSHRSGVITGQSEPNSILSCRMLLM